MDFVDLYKALGGGWAIENPSWQSPAASRLRPCLVAVAGEDDVAKDKKAPGRSRS